MRLFNLVIVWILLQGTPYVRDIFNLPLHDSRSIIIDLIFLIFGFFLLILSLTLKHVNGVVNKATTHDQIKKFSIELNIYNQLLINGKNLINYFCNSLKFYGNSIVNLLSFIYIDRLILLWVIPGAVIYISSRANESSNLMYFKQYIVFFTLIQFISWAIKYRGVNSLFNTILSGSKFYLFVQSLFFVLNIINEGGYQDLIQRNSFPMAMLIMSELSRGINNKNLYKNFILIGLISALISSTKIFFLLLFLLYFVRKIKFLNSYRIFSIILHYMTVLFPVFLPFLILLLTGFEINDVIELGQNRYFINDNIGSLISRIYSVEFMLVQENFWNFFGNNESSIAEVNFWGYPVHNLYFSLVYAHGYLLLLVFFIYNFSIYRFISDNLGLGLILAFIIIYFNDIIPVLSLLFIPYIISHNKNILSMKKFHNYHRF